MKVTLLQSDIEWANPQENIRRAEHLIAAAPKSDLYILPEMWSTGFITQPENIAESDNHSLLWMQQQANKLNASLSGSIAITDNNTGTYRNRLYFVKPQDTAIVYYDKHHLFTYGGEDKKYTPGNQRVIVEWKGVRFLLQICYDLRFPVWSRNNNDYDAIIYVASWPTPRIEAWKTLLKARAIENQCYVLGVNRVGKDPSCEYCGGTALIDPYGKALECAENISTFLTENINTQDLYTFRQKFPVLKDQDSYKLL